MAYNALNFPCGVVPVTKVTAEDIDNLRDYPEDEPLFARAKKVRDLLSITVCSTAY